MSQRLVRRHRLLGARTRLRANDSCVIAMDAPLLNRVHLPEGSAQLSPILASTLVNRMQQCIPRYLQKLQYKTKMVLFADRPSMVQ